MENQESYLDDIFTEEDKSIFDRSNDNTLSKWSIPWSDFVFILFIILFVYAVQMKKKAESNQATTGVESAATTEFTLKSTIENDFLFLSTQNISDNFKNVSTMIQDDQSVKLSMHGPFLFETGKARLTSLTIKILDEIATVIRDIPYKVYVIGHTDNIPIHTSLFETNWELSAARAAKVARYFIEQKNFNPKRFTISGNASYRPIVPNVESGFRARNRRVEIVITRIPYTETYE